jgi:maltose alpha-D-glucosyltransferase/alpha-amylase
MNTPGAEKRMSLYEGLRRAVPEQLAAYLLKQRWFGGKARQIRSTELIDLIPVQAGPVEAFVLLARVEYDSGPGDTYVLPLISASASGDQSANQSADGPAVLNIRRRDDDTRGAVLTDALRSVGFLSGLLDAIEAKLTFTGTRGRIFAASTHVFQDIRASSSDVLRPRVLKGEQSNSSIAYGDRFILKLFRRVEEGVNPDLEIGRFLTEKTRFANVAPVAGSLEYRAEGAGPITLGILQRFVPNEGDAWRFALKSLETFWEQAAKHSSPPQAITQAAANPVAAYESDLPPLASELIGPYLEKVELLGKRTAQLHLALASDPADSAFAPEAFTPSFQREVANAARELAVRNLALLRQKADDLPPDASGLATEVLGRETEILEKFDTLTTAPARGARIRIHGDYHLGQVLYTGSDFVIIDFEGEPARPLAERRARRSALQDVASMVRSFHYAAFAHLLGAAGDSATSVVNAATDRMENPAVWAENWYAWAASHFLASYFDAARSGSFLPPSREEISAVLHMHLLEKAVYELGYELNNRPSWAGIPLAGISQLLAR